VPEYWEERTAGSTTAGRRMTVARAKGAKARADKFFSLIVRSKGACENCGLTTNLQCAHIRSRRFSNTRCELVNAFCLCAACHRKFTDEPLLFASFVHEKRTPSEIAWLQGKSHDIAKVDWEHVASHLEHFYRTFVSEGV
jgi:5-methylcytosine-specific restriction endonuclease McrA